MAKEKEKKKRRMNHLTDNSNPNKNCQHRSS